MKAIADLGINRGESQGLVGKVKKTQQLSDAEIASMTFNGGPCYLRKGYWSQSTAETKVYFPIANILPPSAISKATMPISSKDLDVLFSTSELRVTLTSGVLLLEEELEYNIKSSECIWMLESLSCDETAQVLVLHLAKAETFERYLALYSNFIAVEFSVAFLGFPAANGGIECSDQTKPSTQ